MLHFSRTPIPRLPEAGFAATLREVGRLSLICFQTADCPASAALQPVLATLAEEYAGRLQIATVDLDAAESLAEIYQITAVPTLVVFRRDEPVTRMIGFAPVGLMRLLCSEIAEGGLARDWQWSPVEAAFEDTVVLPLLARWGWSYIRQAPCRGQQNRSSRGRIDVLVTTGTPAAPLTLFENKRRIGSEYELRAAVLQAKGYAQALELCSFVVAAPAGLWVYSLNQRRAALRRSFSSLDLHTDPEPLRHLLLELQAAG